MYAKDYSSDNWKRSRVIGILSPVVYTVLTNDNFTWKWHIDQLQFIESQVAIKEGSAIDKETVMRKLIEEDPISACVQSKNDVYNNSLFKTGTVVTEICSSNQEQSIIDLERRSYGLPVKEKTNTKTGRTTVSPIFRRSE